MESDSQDSGLVARVEAWLRQRIVRGDLADGAKLRQDHIAAEFGYTAAPVREALRRLENARLVVSRPRRGVVVAPIAPGDALEVAEMRAALEGLAMRLALANGNKFQLAAAETAIERAHQTSDIEVWLAANRDFHMALYRPCGRQRLLDSIEDLWLTSDRHLYRVWSNVDYGSKSQDEHKAILSAYIDGDVGTATELVTRHIMNAGKTLEVLLEQHTTMHAA